MECKHEETAIDQGTRARICTSCGLVITESELVDAAFLESSTTGVYQNTGDSKYWKQFRLMKDLATRFSLGESVIEQARHMFVQLTDFDASLVSMGVRGNLTAGICVLLANRKSDNAAAMSLADIAGALNESVSSIGQHLKMLKKQAPELVSIPFSASNHGVFIERFFEEAVKPALFSCKVVITDPRALLSLAESVCRIAQDGWLGVGRKPEPFILACLLLALDSVLLGLGKQKTKIFGKNQKTGICEKFSLPHRTVEQRQEELVQFLVIESTGLLPWPIDKHNMLAHLSDIVKVIEKVGKESSSNPPAFTASQKHRQMMERRVEARKARLAGLYGDEKIKEGSSDEMDLVIDELLQHHAKLEDIVNCGNMGQLYSLLSRYKSISDSNSDTD